MFRRISLIAAACGFALIAGPAAAQTGATIVGTGPGVGGVAETAKITATITAIDPATRAVTLKGPQGGEVTVTAGDAVKNFSQMKVGDLVTAEYTEALTLELKKGGKAVVARTEQAVAGSAKPGQMPAGAVGKQVTVVADVVAVDPATQKVTLKGPKQTVSIKVRDPAQFKLIAVGDQVEATYTEAMAITVTPAPAPAKK
jgi:ABC-type transport system substrate-binding protein